MVNKQCVHFYHSMYCMIQIASNLKKLNLAFNRLEDTTNIMQKILFGQRNIRFYLFSPKTCLNSFIALQTVILFLSYY